MISSEGYTAVYIGDVPVLWESPRTSIRTSIRTFGPHVRSAFWWIHGPATVLVLKITIFNGKIHYKWLFSIAIC